MNYALIENNKVTKTNLPKTGRLSTGETVSNYHLLPHETLLQEGWLPLEDNPPETDDKHEVIQEGYDIQKDKVVVLYEIREIIPPAPRREELEEQARRKVQEITAKKMIQNEELTENEMLDVAPLFPDYEIGVDYNVGDVFNYERGLYEVLQSHTSQTDWKPDQVPALYKELTPKGEVEQWRRPPGAHDVYMKDAIVIYNEQEWISLIDNNVWTPGVYGWEIYKE